ncbi:polysaccharide deacetylase family protein [Planotetraspora sp. A-T 1434]|uniref:polysaccharide deacetylase family protein n=1 Tax=Planotetraspora sp. A-T 1434 TaxID=2979219 RepID=UPI0021C16D9A|nr:polysaccharide deacetylase family protein [Planotetraspora sp. A-T 1434]MCT9931044.1 polysaccharide deacetylase family protein [Planotetraspora sp. A-T 1434]
MIIRVLIVIALIGTAGCAASGPAVPRSTPAVHVTPAPAASPPVTPAAAPQPHPLVRHGRRGSGMVALTFDADMTTFMERQLDSGEVGSYANPRLLAELRRLKVPATIFLTGLWIKRYPRVAAGLAHDPLFELGDHSYDHRAFATPCYGLGETDDMAASVSRTERLLDRLAPGHPKFFRFPGGCFDKAALKAVKRQGVTPVQWDVIGGDAFATSKEAIVRQTLANARDGSIVVLHLGGGKPSGLTDDAVPAIVKGLRKRGLRLVRLSELLGYSR